MAESPHRTQVDVTYKNVSAPVVTESEKGYQQF